MSWLKSKTETQKEPAFMELSSFAKDTIADVQMVFDHLTSLNPDASREAIAILTHTAVTAINGAGEDISTVGK